MKFTVLMFWNWYANVLETMAGVITQTLSHNEIMSFQINKVIIMNLKKYMEITKTYLIPTKRGEGGANGVE